MYYNVAQLLKEPVGSTRVYSFDESVTADDGTTRLFPRGQLSLMRTDKGIWVNGRLEVRMWATCSRCVKSLPQTMRIVIEEEYLPRVDINTGQPLRATDADEGSFRIDAQHTLDFTEALRQYALANQPMKPLCRRDCRGLCPNCGADRNDGPCSCREGEIDHRWTPLMKLLDGSSIEPQTRNG